MLSNSFACDGESALVWKKSHIGQSLCSTSVEMQNIDFVEQQKFRSSEYMAA